MKRWSLVAAAVLAMLGGVAYLVHDGAPPPADAQPVPSPAPGPASASAPAPAPAPSPSPSPSASRDPAETRADDTMVAAPPGTDDVQVAAPRDGHDTQIAGPRGTTSIKPAQPASESANPGEANVERQKRMNRTIELAACRAPDVERRLRQLTAAERTAFRERCARLGVTVAAPD